MFRKLPRTSNEVTKTTFFSISSLQNLIKKYNKESAASPLAIYTKAQCLEF